MSARIGTAPRARLLALAAVALGIAALACDDRRGGDVEIHRDVAATVVSIPPGRREVVVDHEDIPGVMSAMTMPFPVADPALLDGIQPGDRVRLTLWRIDGRLIVHALEPSTEAMPDASPAAGTDLLGGAL